MKTQYWVLSQPLMIILLLKHNALLLFPEHEISETLLRRPSETIYIQLRKNGFMPKLLHISNQFKKKKKVNKIKNS